MIILNKRSYFFQFGLSLPEADSTSFTVMQYNVLADHLARESWFPYSSDDTRSWLRRRELIRREVSQCAMSSTADTEY